MKVQTASTARSTLLKSSKYDIICRNLPGSFENVHGYHQSCYSNFTAVPKIQEPGKTKSRRDSGDKLLRSDIEKQTAGPSGIFEAKCIFCNCIRKYKGPHQKMEQLGSSEAPDAESTIKDAARILDDQEMITKIGSVDFVAKEVKYHHTCRKNYVNRAERKKQSIISGEEGEETEYRKLRAAHDKSFCDISEYVQEIVLDKEHAELLTSLHERYMIYLAEQGYSDSNYKAQTLGSKLLKHFEGKLAMGKSNKRQGNVIYSRNIEKTEAVKYALEQASNKDAKIVEAALHLRALILDARNKCVDFPYPVTADILAKGQAEPPELLLKFFKVLYTGSTIKDPTDKVQRCIEATAEDCLFVGSRGVVKPSKHVCLGLGLKSLTGSRKVIENLNRFGHCLSYHTVEALETDLAMSVTEKNSATPDGLVQQPGLGMGIAWDNYDENSETLSGSGTLHDTVGICYQNICVTNAEPEINQPIQGPGPSRKRKRAFDSSVETDPQPYRKKPKVKTFDYKCKTLEPPEHLLQLERRDQTWAIMCSLFDGTPMWTGWNSQITNDPLPRQTIGYMENLSLPPTRLDVVAETLKISQRVAKECQENFMIVHYDLAIAKPAKQIQQSESPLYDNIFVCFGPFHIQLAYFGSLGYIIDESGGPHILVDSEVLASGSLNGFISGKHFNRCKRLHPMLAQAFRVLHFRAFLKETEDIPQTLLSELQELYEHPSPGRMQILERKDDFVAFMERYEQYTDKTRSGEHGKTAAFWMMYVDLVELYLLFARACHTNDLDLFTFCLSKMCSIFFATHRPNYARWMTKYHLDLVNIDETHPGARAMLEAGALSVRRTDKPFSRSPVDLTLEQTVNADAASRLTGITSFSRSVSARRRWMVTRSVRSELVGHLMDKSGLKPKAAVVQELKPSRIQRDNSDLKKIITGIGATMDPFLVDFRDDKLYCISTGTVMPSDIADSILATESKGQQWYEEFKAGCFADHDRFEKPIPRRKIKSFTSNAVTVKLQTKDRKIKELQGTRDLFGRLLYLSTVKDIDLKLVLVYPLTPVPMTLAHVDGTKITTDKSKLFAKLEARIHSDAPRSVDVCIMDGMFLIQSLVALPPTFGGVAKLIMSCLARLADRVDFLCDTYKHPSIKDITREDRGSVTGEIKVSGPDQRRPKDFGTALKAESFKISLLRFLAEEWSSDEYTSVLKTCELYFGLDDKCYLYKVVDGKMTRTEIGELNCQHEEADTRIVWHIKHACSHTVLPNIVVRCVDTDVLVILVFHMTNIEGFVWMDVGHDKNNTRRYVDVTKLCGELGRRLCRSLPALHAFTGCDYTAAFLRKGKTRPMDIAEKSDQFLQALDKLGASADVDETKEDVLERFVCHLYGKANHTKVDDARYAVFRDKYAPKDDEHPLAKIKGADASLLPPSKPVLHQKILRTNFVAYVWKNADKSVPQELNPTECGWISKDGRYRIKWFDGEQIPDNVGRVIDETSGDEESDDEYRYSLVSDESDDDDCIGV
ncbi:MAG: hypothetical protein N0C90_02335 [Candidatus Thiodiazotropha endolucinida]|nr:hypothetical protein [Candidatus Thiodiazotropha taylori]MCW4260187.1 hypothetical protein [Candidatus Thiodiazotropha endolucinida]